ncbi:MAG: MarR family transcriptional regulator [Candidatus Thorarchaeota archaeon]
MAGLPMSALVVLHELFTKGPMTPKQIRGTVELSPRTVTDALRRLTANRLCQRIPNLNDMRQPLYYADPSKMREMHIDFDFIRAATRMRMGVL